MRWIHKRSSCSYRSYEVFNIDQSFRVCFYLNDVMGVFNSFTRYSYCTFGQVIAALFLQHLLIIFFLYSFIYSDIFFSLLFYSLQRIHNQPTKLFHTRSHIELLWITFEFESSEKKKQQKSIKNNHETRISKHTWTILSTFCTWTLASENMPKTLFIRYGVLIAVLFKLKCCWIVLQNIQFNNSEAIKSVRQ